MGTSNISIAISQHGDEAIVWVDGDTSDALHVLGRTDAIDALCRHLRASTTALGDAMARRGVSGLAAFVSDEPPGAPSPRADSAATSSEQSSIPAAPEASTDPTSIAG